jgi:hypothetical protein
VVEILQMIEQYRVRECRACAWAGCENRGCCFDAKMESLFRCGVAVRSVLVGHYGRS